MNAARSVGVNKHKVQLHLNGKNIVVKILQILSTPMLVRSNPFVKGAVSLAEVKGNEEKTILIFSWPGYTWKHYVMFVCFHPLFRNFSDWKLFHIRCVITYNWFFILSRIFLKKCMQQDLKAKTVWWGFFLFWLGFLFVCFSKWNKVQLMPEKGSWLLDWQL